MKKYFFLICLFYLLFLHLIFSQNKQYSIKDIVGTKKISKDFLINELNVNRINFNLIDSIIQKIYFKNGIYNTIIDSIVEISGDTNNSNNILYLKEGKELLFQRIEFDGNIIFKNEFLSGYFSGLLNKIYNENSFEKIINNLIELYNENGYPFAKISFMKYEIYDKDSFPKLNVKLSINEDSLSRINEIRIIGNEITKSEVIRRQINIKPGDIYNKKITESIRYNLLHLDLFSIVDEPVLSVENGKTILNISLKEKQFNYFDGILGYQPSNDLSGKGNFSGLINISFGNIFGTSRKFKILWNKETKNDEKTEIEYFEPWLLNYPVDILINYKQKSQDSTFVKRNVSISGIYNFINSFNLILSINFETVIPGSEYFQNQNLFKSSSLLYGIEFTIDTRDQKELSSKGMYYSNKLELGNKKYSVLNNSKYTKKFYLNFENYHELFNKQIIFTSLNFHLNDTKDYEISDLFPFGGFKTIRGYRENFFYATKILWTNIEYRFNAGLNSFVYPFIDLGYYYRNSTIDGLTESKDYLYSYGIGITLNTKIGIIRLNYALGKDDSFSEGKIHFGYINQF